MLEKLLSPVQAGSALLKNRVVMAPLTRSRAGQPGDVPRALNVEYYAQRASAGLIVTEASQISRQGQGYAWTPGIYTDAQEAGWKNVVDAVHAKNGKISLQLWHVGRISHNLLQENGAAPVSASALQAANSQCFVVQPDGTPANVPTAEPRALSTEEIPGIVDQYRQASIRAKRAGFDLVEVHAANGYLLQQFMSTNSNLRTDAYGGSLENRARLTLEAVDAAIAEMGADRVGVRISPNFVAHGIADTEAEATALYLAKAFTARGIAYLHIAEPDWVGGAELTQSFREELRAAFPGTLICCGGYSAAEAEALINSGLADAVAFGRPYIANPDLVERFAAGAELNTPDRSTFYGGEEKGYTDYPTL
ncbi:alkene reductase [Undibacterium sp. 14-3-2]|uniref:alkene reductase n=1 Tax=Undibacterium sp. 14-3-2 TaxID=2800129 RepID=UPI001905F9B2|nr:alkene reductase [Undibacterium sp. 14-3-2]MBK1889680.1 alkene reductase [Undibacterium sp. 14-3-2]